jgi:hypothetical protein
MKTRLVAAIIIGVIISTVTVYLYDQMYDCLFPPGWIKFPRSYNLGDCLQMYSNGTLPDWTQERENYAKKQALKMELIDRYKDKPEVVAFYEKYEDANVSIRDDHVSYFAGSEDDFHVRMNMFFDENFELDHIDFHCYFQNEHQFEFPEEDIVSKLERYDCGKKIP